MVMPTKYSKQMVKDICDRLANGESIRSICRDTDMPTWETIRTWLRKKDGFQEEYSRSKQEGIEYMLGDNRAKALETLERAKQGKGKVGLEEAAVLKLLMHDTRWTAGKLVPKVYGDKTQQQITGADDGPLHIKWED